MLSRFDTAAERDRRTERRTDGQTDGIAISISRSSSDVQTRDKNAIALYCTVKVQNF